ncbi:UNVERIFIED_CONTAM: putative carotenoid cleavage dioxygenase 4, chloroplastic [Sesamum radiatum]|uniref:Carotenoid cleavage dioxygenase 4, chloroplastic n=1 Tax=Sesamum radiatum TaxID=300843 RepID=A0AAW2L2Z6_SESRA
MQNGTQESFKTILFKSLDDFISTYMDLPLRPCIDPMHVLSGNFAPVHELPPTPCHVEEGSLPSALDGVYIRNGPNPQFIPHGPFHVFDGDGMLHSIRISNGEAVFCSRYVKTYKYMVEQKMGYPFIVSPFSSFNGTAAAIARCMLVVVRALAGYFNPMINGFGTANTSLAMFGGKLFALCESDLPYQVRVTSDGDIITVSRHDLYANDPTLRMTAHPKIDSETGEVFAFRCHIVSPFLTFFQIDTSGRKGPDVPISSLKRGPVIHDVALTKNFIIFQDTQVEFNLVEIMRGKLPMVFDPDKVPRLGILPRYARDETELVWIDAPGFNMLHSINAWEEELGKKIVILATNLLSIEHGLENLSLYHSVVEKLTIDVETKKVVRRRLCNESLEFGVINPAYAGKKNKYVYAGVAALMPRMRGVMKFDVSRLSADGGDCTVASRLYGPGWYGGEACFVPREPDNPAAEEDDGFLVTYVHNEESEESWFVVMNAKSPTLDIVARVRLPGRVPYGFHGLFVRETDVN